MNVLFSYLLKNFFMILLSHHSNIQIVMRQYKNIGLSATSLFLFFVFLFILLIYIFYCFSVSSLVSFLYCFLSSISFMIWVLIYSFIRMFFPFPSSISVAFFHLFIFWKLSFFLHFSICLYTISSICLDFFIFFWNLKLFTLLPYCGNSFF